MHYWLTTHWPRPKDTPVSQPHADVWVKDGQWNVIKNLALGDLVFIYESKSGPLPLRRNPDGSTSAAPKAPGKAGIVALVRVIESAKEPPNSMPAKYDNGETMWWRFRARTAPVNSGGYIPLTKFLPLIGYSKNYNLHGFGENHSGVKQLNIEQFDTLRRLYEESADHEDAKVLKRNNRGSQVWGPGGEGEEHRALKERIAADPASVLGEEGLSFFSIEFPFKCTGDRIDVVLRDKSKKYVAVEVEVECDASHLAGPLQCAKYRAMLAYLLKRPLEEVRCILAAHKIAPTVGKECADFEIETKIVKRSVRAPVCD